MVLQNTLFSPEITLGHVLNSISCTGKKTRRSNYPYSQTMNSYCTYYREVDQAHKGNEPTKYRHTLKKTPGSNHSHSQSMNSYMHPVQSKPISNMNQWNNDFNFSLFSILHCVCINFCSPLFFLFYIFILKFHSPLPIRHFYPFIHLFLKKKLFLF